MSVGLEYANVYTDCCGAEVLFNLHKLPPVKKPRIFSVLRKIIGHNLQDIIHEDISLYGFFLKLIEVC